MIRIVRPVDSYFLVGCPNRCPPKGAYSVSGHTLSTRTTWKRCPDVRDVLQPIHRMAVVCPWGVGTLSRPSGRLSSINAPRSRHCHRRRLPRYARHAFVAAKSGHRLCHPVRHLRRLDCHRIEPIVDVLDKFDTARIGSEIPLHGVGDILRDYRIVAVACTGIATPVTWTY